MLEGKEASVADIAIYCEVKQAGGQILVVKMRKKLSVQSIMEANGRLRGRMKIWSIFHLQDHYGCTGRSWEVVGKKKSKITMVATLKDYRERGKKKTPLR